MTSSSPHVLYVAWGFPPCRGGGVYRALATANAFARQGWRVTVLTATEETFTRYTGADRSLLTDVDPSITVVRVPFEWPALNTDLRSWSATRMFVPSVWRRIRKRHDLRDFPEVGYGPWMRPLQAAARRIHRNDPVDLVVGSANPNVDFSVGDVLNREHGVPYVMDYRDAWTLDVFSGDEVHEPQSRVGRLECDLISRSTEVWFVNEPIRAWHQKRYPAAADRMHVVANGFDPEYAPLPRSGPPPAERPLTFGYIGTVSGKVPLRAFANGWAEAMTDPDPALRGASAQIWGYLGFYSTPNATMLRTVESFAQYGLSYRGPLPKQQVRSVYEGFDVCLLILGAGKYVTSGKVFEYAASALPIVSVHDPGNAASTVLRDYPLWFPVSDVSDSGDVAAAIEAAAKGARSATPEVHARCWEFAQSYSRDLQLSTRVSALRGAVTDEKEATRR